MMNGAIFVESGSGASNHPARMDLMPFKPGTYVPKLTKFSGALECFVGKPCQAFPPFFSACIGKSHHGLVFQFANTNSTKRPNPYVFVHEGIEEDYLGRVCVREEIKCCQCLLSLLHYMSLFFSITFSLFFRLFGKNGFKEDKKTEEGTKV